MKKITLSKVVNFIIGLAQQTGGTVGGSKDVDPELKKYARELAAEGIVLLKNDGVLPLAGKTVSVFGRVQNDYFCVGYGSGGDVKPPYKVNLIDGLTSNGKISLNGELKQLYTDWCAANVPDEGFWGHWPFNFEEMPLENSVVKKAAESSDAAIVVIGRAAGEDREQKLDKGSYYLADGEKELLNKVTAAFEKTVVIIDAGNVIDLKWISDYGKKISAVVYAWQGGMESGNALADVLSGDVNPSGRLTDTVAENYADYPSAGNFGAKKSNSYVEDVYVGYRYFETFAKDKVLYPFGFGLSYTDFSTEFSLGFDGRTAYVVANVKNVGNVKGKDVVQVYVEPPQGALGKPLKNLAAFAKTDNLERGGEQRISLSFDLESICSYDDFGYTGYKSAYIAEAGEYVVYGGENVRDAVKIGSFVLDKPYIRQAEEACAVEKDNAFDVLYPVFNGGAVEKKYRRVATENRNLASRITERLPAEIAQKKDLKLLFDDVKAGKASLDDFIATLSDEELEVLLKGDLKMNSPLGVAGNAGAFGGITESLQSKGVPPVITTDGPSGIRLLQYASLLPCGTAAACAWNPELVEKLYGRLGLEMREKGTDVLLGPGMNIHRDPLCGRNFEYFSEDPLVSGLTAAAFIKGVQSVGLSACPKHYACNNQETNRNHGDSRVSERALREIYLKGFGICIKNASPKMIMGSYNKVNGVFSYYNYDLMTTLLRGEYGFDGLVTTDWWTVGGNDVNFKGIFNNGYRVRAQADLLMPGGNRLNGKYDGSILKSKEGGLTRAEMQRSAKNVLNLILRIGK